VYNQEFHVDYKLERREEMQSTSHTASSLTLSLSLFISFANKEERFSSLGIFKESCALFDLGEKLLTELAEM
jgi:hypothetical protein